MSIVIERVWRIRCTACGFEQIGETEPPTCFAPRCPNCEPRPSPGFVRGLDLLGGGSGSKGKAGGGG